MTSREDGGSEILAAFERVRGMYEALLTEMRFSVETILENNGIKVAAINGRVKSKESLAEKLQRKPVGSLGDVPDLAGLRIVTLFESDTGAVLDVLRGHFVVVEVQAPEDTLGHDRMGYSAHHLIVTMGSDGYAGPRYDGLRDLRCEIQVRTVIQDAWALVSHTLVYKNEDAVPKPLRRRLNNVSSLLEIAQDVFESVREARTEYLEEIEKRQEDQEDFLSLPLDSDTLATYTKHRFPALPISHKIHDLLMRDLDFGRYKTLNDLDHVVCRAVPALSDYASQHPILFRYGTDYITKSLGLLDPDFRKRHPFGEQTRAFFSQKEKERQ